ncbi:hypothetical protein JCM5353_006020 [Sporobolomyces roseus]
MHPSLALVVFANVLATVLAESTKITLARRDTDFRRRDGSINMQALDEERERLTAWVHSLTLNLSLEKNRASLSFWSAHNASYALEKRANTRYLDYDGKSLWTSTVSVGTPPQTFNVYYDTASADLSLPGAFCTDSSCASKEARYNVSDSSTANKTTFRVTSAWSEGTAGNGLLVRDTVTIGSSTVVNQDVVAQEVIGSSVANRASDGVGLGFRDLSAARSYSFPFTLFQQGGSRSFSMLLSRIPGKSRLTFGIDRNIIGSTPVWFPVGRDLDSSWRTFWQIAQSTAFVNGTQAWSGRDNFILDSGSSLIIAPPDAAAEFWSSFPGSRAEGSGYYSYLCDNPPVVELSFGNGDQRFAINEQDFNIGTVTNDTTRCLGALVGQDLDLHSSWVIGEVFFKSWLLIFLRVVASKFRCKGPRDIGFRQADGTISIEALDAERLRLTNKYNAMRYRPVNSTEDLEKRDTTILPLSYDGQSLWQGPMTIGSPPQSFNVYFDTGSADLALAASTCTDQSCNGKARYDHKASSTAVATKFNVFSSWSTGSSGNGLLVRDTVTIGKATVNTQDVVAASSIGSSVSSRAADGVVGLSFRDLSAARSYAFPFTLFQQGGSEYFSFLLSRNPGQSKITFNGYDRRYIKSGVQWYPVSKSIDEQFRTLWQIGRSSVYANNRNAWRGTANFAFDSGSPLIIAPPDAAAEFWASIYQSRKEDNGYYSFLCASPPKVAFTFNRLISRKWYIDPRDFNLGPLESDPTRCLGAIISQDLNLGDTWLLGDVFFKDVSQNRIGIAAPRY